VTENDRASGASIDALPAPPPSAALLQAMSDLRPVRPRVPARALAAILAVGLAYPALVLVLKGPRFDLPFLPVAWVAVMALLWAAGVVVPLGAAVLPRRDEVLPSASRAATAATAAALVLLALGFFATVNAPGKTIIDPSAARVLHCLATAAVVIAPVLLVAAFALRRLHPMGAARVAAAVGAAGGALGGLTLHFLCPYGGGVHVGAGHAGGVILGAVAGALVLGRFVRA
jgi:hypothetical protein